MTFVSVDKWLVNILDSPKKLAGEKIVYVKKFFFLLVHTHTQFRKHCDLNNIITYTFGCIRYNKYLSRLLDETVSYSLSSG